MNAPDDIAKINDVRAAFTKAYNAGDAAALSNLYTTDAISMGNHQPSDTGRDAITARQKAGFEQMTFSIDITSEETRTMGNFGFDRGRFKISVTPKAGGAPMSDEGRYLVLLEKGTDGNWRVSRDIDNSSLPMPAPPAAAPAAAPAGMK
jgi:uncharacterized protein (TIGR02246 family)